jgi:hypothetical protein
LGAACKAVGMELATVKRAAEIRLGFKC